MTTFVQPFGLVKRLESMKVFLFLCLVLICTEVYSQQTNANKQRLTTVKVESTAGEQKILHLENNIKQIQEKINTIKKDPAAFSEAQEKGFIEDLENLKVDALKEIERIKNSK